MKNTWSDTQAYDTKAKELARHFRENIRKMDGVPCRRVGCCTTSGMIRQYRGHPASLYPGCA